MALTLSFVGSVAADPVAWTRARASPRSAFAVRADTDSILASRSISSDPSAFASSSYDYIIVGAGTAGLALAARLSESGKYTVGVLEAGISGLNAPIIDIPGYFGADIGTIYDCERLIFKFSILILLIRIVQGTTQLSLAQALRLRCLLSHGREERYILELRLIR